MCGGTHSPATAKAGAIGLSPRVRGNHSTMIYHSTMIWSIPACAGEPKPTPACWPWAWVYPRVCGGTGMPQHRSPQMQGLSPRVRGNRRDATPVAELAGSIPACAGEPARAAGAARPSRVYPRVCGGTGWGWPSGPFGAGLSPRVRGNHEPRCRAGAGRGSIPACAGEPTTMLENARQPPVYPRVCGGTPSWPLSGDGWSGLSPRVRGNRRERHWHGICQRSIPACAGEP